MSLRGARAAACIALAVALRVGVGAGLGAGLGAIGGCSRAPAPEPSIEGTPLADVVSVATEDETSFTDLPGVEGFEQLSPALQAAVLVRANRARCDCGCPRHSVNACLHQDDLCDVALGLANGFVADAQALALNSPEIGALTPESPPAVAGESSPTPSGASAPGVPPPT